FSCKIIIDSFIFHLPIKDLPMHLLSRFRFYFKKGIASEKANFSIIFALSVMSFLLLIGFLIYVLDWHYKKNSMESANNAAILAGASKMVSNLSRLGDRFESISNHAKRALIDDAKRFIKNHIKESLSGYSAVFYNTEIQNIVNSSRISMTHMANNRLDSSNNTIFYNMDVMTSYDYRLQFIEHLLNQRYNQKIVSFIPALLRIEMGERPIFLIELVVDLSGSMHCAMNSDPEDVNSAPICQDKKRTKMAALKNALLLFLDSIDLLSHVKEDVYMGLIGYTTRVEKNIEPSWGTEKVRQYVTRDMDSLILKPTDSTPAMKQAYQILTSDKKRSFFTNFFRQGVKIPSLPFQKFIIFLTDGENNNFKSNVNTIKICDKAKENFIKIVTISINASPNGQRLLKTCVSSPEYHYNVVNADSLIHVFQNISQLMVHRKYSVILKG
ncbi:vWA domain-containing protein, partial [Candidatus Liberibacter asiaticus]